MTIQVSIWAILVASIVNLLVGVAWYSPFVFGRSWSRLSRIKPIEILGSEAVALYVGSFFSGLVFAAILAVVISISGVMTVWEGAILAAMVWAGFTAAPTLVSTIRESRSFGLWGINAGYPLVSALLMNVIFIVWR